jgi:hypothetical protein
MVFIREPWVMSTYIEVIHSTRPGHIRINKYANALELVCGEELQYITAILVAAKTNEILTLEAECRSRLGTPRREPHGHAITV